MNKNRMPGVFPGVVKCGSMERAGAILRQTHRDLALLIHHPRPLAAQATKVELFDDLKFHDNNGLMEVESILRKLESVKPILRTVVEMKVFEGCTSEEITESLGCSAVTIHRHWKLQSAG